MGYRAHACFMNQRLAGCCAASSTGVNFRATHKEKFQTAPSLPGLGITHRFPPSVSRYCKSCVEVCVDLQERNKMYPGLKGTAHKVVYASQCWCRRQRAPRDRNSSKPAGLQAAGPRTFLGSTG